MVAPVSGNTRLEDYLFVTYNKQGRITHLKFTPRMTEEAKRLASEAADPNDPENKKKAISVASALDRLLGAIRANPSQKLSNRDEINRVEKLVKEKIIPKYNLGTSYGKWWALGAFVSAAAAALAANACGAVPHKVLQLFPFGGVVSGALNETTKAFGGLPSFMSAANIASAAGNVTGAIIGGVSLPAIAWVAGTVAVTALVIELLER